ncbi:ROK family protein [Caldicellulosiruptoraceae bacterium PP1]
MRLRKGNKELIKDINRALVINEIRTNEKINRKKIAQNLGLGLSTVTYIIDELINQNLVFEVGEADSTGGRKPILLQFNYDYGYTIGIRIKNNLFEIALTNLKPNIISMKRIPFKKGSSSDLVVDLIIHEIDNIINSLSSDKKLLGIGISVSGIVDSNKGKLIFSGLLNWEQVDFKLTIENKFGIPVYVENDVKAFTQTELWFGYGKEFNNFLVITYGAGIGSGIVINKRIYNGDFGGAGELGHIILYANGRKCECGNHGCLEAYSSESFISDYIREHIKFYSDSIIDINTELNIDDVYQYALLGDYLAIHALKASAQNLGLGIISAINLLNLSTIILAGEGMIAKDFLLPVIKDTVSNNFFKRCDSKVTILTSQLNDDAWVIGASILAVRNLFDIPIFYEQKHKTI